jgi:hypothetical protein
MLYKYMASKAKKKSAIEQLIKTLEQLVGKDCKIYQTKEVSFLQEHDSEVLAKREIVIIMKTIDNFRLLKHVFYNAFIINSGCKNHKENKENFNEDKIEEDSKCGCKDVLMKADFVICKEDLAVPFAFSDDLSLKNLREKLIPVKICDTCSNKIEEVKDKSLSRSCKICLFKVCCICFIDLLVESISYVSGEVCCPRCKTSFFSAKDFNKKFAKEIVSSGKLSTVEIIKIIGNIFEKENLLTKEYWNDVKMRLNDYLQLD